MFSKKSKYSILAFSIAIAFAVSIAFAPSAMAREFAEIYTDCGLGAMIAPRTPVVAAVTNVTFDLGTTAILSNSSSPDTCAGGKAKIIAFISDTYEVLESDIAKGGGNYLESLIILAGISENNKNEFVTKLRGDFASFVSSDNYGTLTKFQKAENLYNMVYLQSTINA